MNIDTGDIKRFNEEEIDKIRKMMDDTYVEVDEKDMTKKQKVNMKVSLKDHRSKLGKALTQERRKRGYNGMNRNQKRNLRKKLKK